MQLFISVSVNISFCSVLFSINYPVSLKNAKIGMFRGYRSGFLDQWKPAYSGRSIYNLNDWGIYYIALNTFPGNPFTIPANSRLSNVGETLFMGSAVLMQIKSIGVSPSVRSRSTINFSSAEKS